MRENNTDNWEREGEREQRIMAGFRMKLSLKPEEEN